MTANFGFSKVVHEIEVEIGHAYLPGCIQWTDQKFDSAWSRLLDQFNAVLLAGEPEKISVFVRMYRTQIMGYIDAYKKERNQDELGNFLNQLELQMGGAK